MNINQVWPEWHEDCLLGEGSFGKVYRAKRVEYGRTFYSAIKVITVPKSQQEVKFARMQGMNDTEIYNYFQSLVENLLNEITLMDNLKGAKNIVGIEDYKIVERQGEIGWDIFIRMELLTPFDSFASNPEFSQKDVIRLGVDICTALETCEQNGVIHRDIKPDNIFISRFGEYKLGDFGIARKLESTQANFSRKGTLNYMAPEVYKSEEYGTAVDIYSLGLVLYTLLNNNRIAFLPSYPQPITYKDNEEALAKRLAGESMVLPCNASASLGATIVKACAFMPQDRYLTATEFKNALINEWNILAQSGDNREINSDAMRFGDSVDSAMQRTTNDMNEYVQATTVLDQPVEASYYQPDMQAQSASVTMSSDYDDAYITVRSSKLCRILAYPLNILICILAVVLLMSDGITYLEKTMGITMLGVGACALIGANNKRSVGIALLGLSLGYVVDGVSVVLGGIHAQIPIQAFVTIISGLLFMFGGISILSQREVRLGGSLCIGAAVIEWIFNLYQLVNGGVNVGRMQIFVSVAAVAAFVWSYGYDSRSKAAGVQKIFHIVTYILSGVAVAVSIARNVNYLLTMLK